MKKIKIIIVLVLFSLPSFIFSANVTFKKAEIVAKNFYYEHSDIIKSQIIFSDIFIKSKDTENYYYVFNLSNSKGFLIISAEDAYYPIIAYSLKDNYIVENQPNNIKYWMQNYINQIKYLRENKINADEKISSLWQKYETNPLSFVKDDIKDTIVAPLTENIRWNQSPGWNDYCPAGTPTGCVATAMSIIMKYHQYPITGTGNHTYNDYGYWSNYNTGTHTADFGNTRYFWNNMPDDQASIFSALLCYHAGISVEMDYAPAGSGASSYDVPNALRNYFTYTCSNFRSKSSYSQTNWINMLKAQLDNAKPMYYSGSDDNGGHAFVCDGYDDSDYFNFNFGWGGQSNGFYSISDVGGFHNYQGAVMDITPGNNNYPNAPQSITATLNTENINDFIVELSWEAPVNKSVATYSLYRNFDKIAEVSSSVSDYVDNTADAGNYYYSVSAKYSDNQESLTVSDYLQGKFSITFHAINPSDQNEIFTADVSFNNEVKPTTFIGAVFSDVPYGGNEVYIISHPDYPTTSGYLDVDENKSVNVLMDGTQVGINKINSKAFSVYPNPSNGIISFNLPDTEKYFNFEITDYLGKIILSGGANPGINEVNLENVSKGYYILKIYSKKNTYNNVLIIK